MKDPEVLRDEFIENLRDSYVNGFADGYNAGVRDAAPKETQWIPVTERLPKCDFAQNFKKEVLVTGIEAISGKRVYSIKVWDVDRWRPESAPSIWWDAWMPLPIRIEEANPINEPTQKQVSFANYLAKRMCQDLPSEYTKEAYSEFISKWKPAVKAEDDGMNEPSAWQMQYEI